MRKCNLFLFLLILFSEFHCAQAQDAKVNFSAYLDSYYAYDFSRPTSHQRFYITQYDRHNEFNINHAWIKGAYQSEKLRASLALQTGTYVTNNYGAEPEKLYQMIYEAYSGYRITPKSWLDIGVFSGHFGYESALALERELYSPALSTEYTPYYQTGIRYTYNITDQTTFRAVIVNGWQNIGETNDGKSGGLAVDHQANDRIFLSYGNYLGVDQGRVSDQVGRFHQNLITKFQPTSRTLIVLSLDYTYQSDFGDDSANTQDEGEAFFLTLITKYAFSDHWSLAMRYEYVRDRDEILIDGIADQFDLHVVSTSVNFQPLPNAVFKLEPKLYAGQGDHFFGEKGIGTGAIALNAGFAVRIE